MIKLRLLTLSNVEPYELMTHQNFADHRSKSDVRTRAQLLDSSVSLTSNFSVHLLQDQIFISRRQKHTGKIQQYRILATAVLLDDFTL
jgi:hypothetical protein